MYSVIMVDDEPWALKGIENIIPWEDYGYKIAALCSNVEEALEAIDEVQPYVVITDIRMPEISGIELIERIRASRLDAEIVIVSAHPDFDIAKKAISHGVFDYIMKPLDKKEVAKLAERLAEKLAKKSKLHERKRLELLPEESGLRYSENSTVAEVQRYIAENYMKHFAMKDIAEHFFLSEPYLFELFRKYSDTSMVNFQKQLRISHAARLLRETEKSVRDIADAVGYEDQGYFGRIFKKETGNTPEGYRAEARQCADGADPQE